MQSVWAVAAVQLPQYSNVKPSLPRAGMCGLGVWFCLGVLSGTQRARGWWPRVRVVQGCRRGLRALAGLSLTLRPPKAKVCFLCGVRERVDWVGLTLG